MVMMMMVMMDYKVDDSVEERREGVVCVCV